MIKKIPSLLVLILLWILVPTLTFAQNADTFGDKPNVDADGTVSNIKDNGFIPCSGTNCSPCDLVVLFNTVLEWFLGISFLLFVILAVLAGIKMVTAQGAVGLEEAKKSFTNAFIGLIIILSAWLIVDTLMRTLIGGNGEVDGYGPWTEVKCARQSEVTTQAGLFDGDVPYVPGTMMTPSKAVAYTGGPLGQCTNSFCSPTALKTAGFTQTQADVMSCIALTESSGVPSTPPFNVTNPNHKPLSTACGLFQITRTTWNGVASGGCDSFSQCQNARCNTENALKLVKASGYSSWTCPGCNNKAGRCVQQFGG